MAHFVMQTLMPSMCAGESLLLAAFNKTHPVTQLSIGGLPADSSPDELRQYARCLAGAPGFSLCTCAFCLSALLLPPLPNSKTCTELLWCSDMRIHVLLLSLLFPQLLEPDRRQLSLVARILTPPALSPLTGIAPAPVAATSVGTGACPLKGSCTFSLWFLIFPEHCFTLLQSYSTRTPRH